MGSKGDSKKAKLAAILMERSITFIDDAVWTGLATALSPISQSYLRRLLRDSGVSLSASVEGVNQSSFADLERTLIALSAAYAAADAVHRNALRRTIITAKDHARWAAQRLKDLDEKKRAKEEMVLWMRTWLENPSLFPSWVELRKRAAALETAAAAATESRSTEP